MSRAAGLHAPGTGLARKAASPRARGGATAHSVNPARKSCWRGQRREARSNTSEEKPQGREAALLVLNDISPNRKLIIFQACSSQAVIFSLIVAIVRIKGR